MGLKGQKTTAQPCDWNSIMNLILKLERDKNFTFASFIALMCYTGSRCGDVLSLKWEDVLNKDKINIVEQKTRKHRQITMNKSLSEILNRCYNSIEIKDPTQYIFLNRFGTKPISIQYINRRLKLIMEKYKVVKDTSVIKTHSLRKTFGAAIFKNNNNSEKSLIMLSMLLNHNSITTTKIYIGVQESDLADLYTSL